MIDWFLALIEWGQHETLRDWFFQVIVAGIAAWAVPVIILAIVTIGLIRKVPVYEVFVDGAKEGFTVAVTIMPYLVAILVAIGIFRDVNLMDAIVQVIEPVTLLVYLPGEILPLAIIRPLSGGGAAGILNSIMVEYGPDSYVGMMASVMQGSTETTFYVLAVYFGAVNITKTRHAVIAGLAGDFAGVMACAVLCRIFFADIWPY